MDQPMRCLLLTCWIVCVTVGCAGSRPQSAGLDEAAKDRAADVIAPADMVEFTLEKTDEQHLLVHWKVTNRDSCPIWVPWIWGLDQPRVTLPIGSIVPPADLLLVWGNLKNNMSRGMIYEGAETVELIRLDPQMSLAGTLTISLPYTPQEEMRSPFLSSFRPPEQDEPDQERTLDHLQAVQLAVEYWTANPEFWDAQRGDEATDLPTRYTFLQAVIDGELSNHILSNAYRKQALSKRELVDIPLKDKIQIYSYSVGTK